MNMSRNITDISVLQWRLIYSIIVAGKSATFTEQVMCRLILPNSPLRPFGQIDDAIKTMGLDALLRRARTGNYGKLKQALIELIKADIDLATCKPEGLEAIHGIGPKTSRFFIMWTRPGEWYAALDVHVLRWMRMQGHDAPRHTPSGKKYGQLEKAFIKEAVDRGMTPRELDSQIWEAGAMGKAAQ